jgi:hypothetical protein
MSGEENQLCTQDTKLVNFLIKNGWACNHIYKCTSLEGIERDCMKPGEITVRTGVYLCSPIESAYINPTRLKKIE